MEQDPNKEERLNPWLNALLAYGVQGLALTPFREPPPAGAPATPPPAGAPAAPVSRSTAKFGKKVGVLADFLKGGAGENTPYGQFFTAIGESMSGRPDDPDRWFEAGRSMRRVGRGLIPAATLTISAALNASKKQEKEIEPELVREARKYAFPNIAIPERIDEGSTQTFLNSAAGKIPKKDFDAASKGEWTADLKFTSGLENLPPGEGRQGSFDRVAVALARGRLSPSTVFNDLSQISAQASEREELGILDKASKDQTDPVGAKKKAMAEIKKNKGEPSMFYRIPGYVENWSDKEEYRGTRAMVGVMMDKKTNNAHTVIQWYDPNDPKKHNVIVGPVE